MPYWLIMRPFILAALGALLAACNSSSSGAEIPPAPPGADAQDVAQEQDAPAPPDSAPEAASDAHDAAAEPAVEAGPTLLTGTLVGGTGDYPGPIGGVHFRSGAQTGYTDAAGAFTYEQGEDVVFGVADVEFRATPGRALLSPWQLSANGDCTPSADLERLLVLLQSLDADDDPATGTQLAEFPPGSPVRQLGSLADTDVAALVDQLIPGRTPVDKSDAMNRFITQVDGEQWKLLSIDTFNSVDSAIRSQGITTDGTFWYFSWRLGLGKTDASFNTLMKNNLAIPPALALQGSDHIGDIDYWNGSLYVPVEDSNGYKQPKVVLYDTDLNSGKVFSIDNTLLTQGVPWVAVDGPRSSVYLAEWDPTPEILVFSLADLAHTKSIPLSTPSGRIQGAKVFEGALYANVDNAAKTVSKINLETGTVIDLFALNESVELEGIAFLARPDGSQMHQLNTNASYTTMQLRHHQRTRDPLRKQLCP